MRRCATCNKSVRDEILVCPRCGHTLPMVGVQSPAALRLPKAPQTMSATPAQTPPPAGPADPQWQGAGTAAWRWLRTNYRYAGIAVTLAFFILAITLGGYEWGRYFHLAWIATVGITTRAFRGLKKRGKA